ncbi:hypothetical protein [Desulfopila sp. IMCC35008]|uniref:hypothetical protein n=1 Tax=Desulfopila sp. IMCC35008 TaxID=2653858 RepID=UPI0013D65323|nr:hypothetical protein [Desulfopila sp. IMCC35008]
MAPARMIAFMENHADECDVCQKDPDLQDEIAKIREMILPESKIPKAVRLQNEQAEAAIAVEEDEENDETEKSEEEDIYDDDDDFSEEPDLVDSEK